MINKRLFQSPFWKPANDLSNLKSTTAPQSLDISRIWRLFESDRISLKQTSREGLGSHLSNDLYLYLYLWNTAQFLSSE